MKRLKIGVIAFMLMVLSPFGAKGDVQGEQAAGRIAKEPVMAPVAVTSGRATQSAEDMAAAAQGTGFTESSQAAQDTVFTEDPQVTRETGFTEDPQAMEQAAGSVVMLEIFDGQGKRLRTGSGFCAFEPGLLVTAAHVITNMEYAIATCDDGKTFRVDHAIVADEESDVAICAIPEDAGLTPLEAATGDPLRGEKVAAIGSQFGIVNLITLGNVCGNFEMSDATWILFTAPVSSGNSGGPVLNDQGKVTGITAGAYDKGQNMNLAAPILVAKELYREINAEVE
ncbi:MAG: trypsin-like peptidase domain-containing protein [Lachnospiraceae bacterium]|nr:trypsin-like peptidase domain-containing protein [Lachnospiraceae bacterium]